MSDTDTIIIDYLYTKCALCKCYDPDKYIFQKRKNLSMEKILVCAKCSNAIFKSDFLKSELEKKI